LGCCALITFNVNLVVVHDAPAGAEPSRLSLCAEFFVALQYWCCQACGELEVSECGN
jgi:hypothetical protein